MAISVDTKKVILRDPYLEWLETQKLPVIDDFAVDLLAVETAPWPRLGAEAAFVNLKGRGDFVSLIVELIPPGKSTVEQHHLFEEIVYVLEGHGSTTVIGPGGRKHSFEWGPQSLFALPLNARYRHFNASGTTPARLACTVNLPFLMGLFRSEDFLFDTEFTFPERFADPNEFQGKGVHTPFPEPYTRQLWETNFVPDLAVFDELRPLVSRGAGGTSIIFIMADGTLHAHMSEMPVGTYKKAHRHGPEYHVFCVTGTGYSLLWFDGEHEFRRVNWRHGTVYAPADQQFHQHFNTGSSPARYLATNFGSARYPLTTTQKYALENAEKKVSEGGMQIEYEDQDPRIHRLYAQEMAKTGTAMRMDAFPVPK